MENEIIELMQSNGFDKIKLLTLVDLSNEFCADLEEYPIVANVVEIKNGEVYIYDESDEVKNGVIEPIYKLSDLSKGVAEDVKLSVVDTLGIIKR